MATFIDVASNVTSPRGRAVIADILSSSQFASTFHLLNAFELDKYISNFIPTAASGILQTRQTGSAFTYSYAAPASSQSITQAIAGAAVVVDRSYYRDANLGGSIQTWFEKNLKKTAVAYGKELDEKLCNGSGTSGAIKGLATILDGTDNLPGFSTTGVYDAADFSSISSAKHMDLRANQTTFDAEAIAFKEMLLTILAGMDAPKVIVMNRGTWARVQSIAGKLGLLGAPTNEFFKTPSINGLQTIILNNTAIPSNEADNTATPLTVTSSIYIMSPAEMNCSLVTNGFDYIDFDYLEAKEAGQEKWEMGIAWKFENPDAIARIRNIRV